APIIRIGIAQRRVLGRAGVVEVVLVIGFGRAAECRQRLVPRRFDVVVWAIAEMHVNGPVRVGDPADIVADDDGIAGPVVPAGKHDLSGGSRAYFEGLPVIGPKIVYRVVVISLRRRLVDPGAKMDDLVIVERQGKGFLVKGERGDSGVLVVVDRP